MRHDGAVRTNKESVMLPGMELMGCQNLAVPAEVMHHVVRVESSYNPYAIGVVGGRLVRQPKNLPEAVATARMLESRGYNFSIGLAQVNRYNLEKYGLETYEKAFDVCPNLTAGSRILAECFGRSGNDWGKSFSCYYSGNFVTGYRHGYVQKVYASIKASARPAVREGAGLAIEVVGRPTARPLAPSTGSAQGQLAMRRISGSAEPPSSNTQSPPMQQALAQPSTSANASSIAKLLAAAEVADVDAQATRVAVVPQQQGGVIRAASEMHPATAGAVSTVSVQAAEDPGSDTAFVF